MVFLYGNAVRVRNRLDSTGQIWAAARPRFGFTNISLILQRCFNLYIVPIISDSRGVNLSIWLQIPVSVLQSIPHPHWATPPICGFREVPAPIQNTWENTDTVTRRSFPSLYIHGRTDFSKSHYYYLLLYKSNSHETSPKRIRIRGVVQSTTLNVWMGGLP